MGDATITSPPLTTPLYFPKTVTMQEPTSEYPEPSVVLQPSNSSIPIVPVQQPLSAEDKMILYAALQAIANELRSLDHAQANKKHHEER